MNEIPLVGPPLTSAPRQDRVILITGTAGGQGRAAALRFGSEGDTVVGCDLHVEGNLETQAMAEQAGSRFAARQPVDVMDADAVHTLVDDVVEEFGRIDVLYNNAGAVRFGAVGEIDLDDWRFTLRNELESLYVACHFAWPHFKRQREGCIINTASIAGLVGSKWLSMSAHCAAKGGVIALTRQLAVEGAPHGIRANCISPGPIWSPATQRHAEDPDARARFVGGTLSNEAGQPDDVAALAVFLASSSARFVNGANLVIDGGTTAF